LALLQSALGCVDGDRGNSVTKTTAEPSLPDDARLPINRCNLPAVILGSLTFQRHPAPLALDGVAELHAELFRQLDELDAPERRAQRFVDYMVVHFRLESLEDAGLADQSRHRRANANYLRVVRGWLFDADSREGAVMKGWVESRFGLLPRHHGGPIHSTRCKAYTRYAQERATGLYNTNALESQLDLLYTYCQYELSRQHRRRSHFRLYRGVNRLADHEILEHRANGNHIVIFNSLNSFTASRERADEFGDYVLEADIPLPKILFYSRLLPGALQGEDEYLVIGGVYEVQVSRV
jgi:NAD+--dinitrogen-reductase ADP-D-ribosyltransferase